MGKFEKKKRRHWLWIVPLAVIVAAAVFCFVINRWQVTVALNGKEEVTVECGTQYIDEGAVACFGGTIFPADLKTLDVTAENRVDAMKPGDYSIVYRAEYLMFRSSAERTVHIVDTTLPELTLLGDTVCYDLPELPFVEPGYAARDNVDGDITDRVTCEEIDGKLVYTVSDSSGNTVQATRRIFHEDSLAPEIILEGGDEVDLNAGIPYEEPGFSCIDNCAGDITDRVTVSGEVDCYHKGVYEITYTAEDDYHNVAMVTRTVNVVPVPQPDKVDPGDKVIYLTFDDGPSPYTKQLLDVLDAYNVKATFFVVNTAYSDLIAEEFARGHSIGIHTASHNYDKIYASEEAYFEDLQIMQDLIVSLTGQRTTLVRFPGGSSNTVSKFNPGIMTTLAADLTDMGYQYFDWNVSSGDAGETTETQRVFENVINGVQWQNVSIVLQHDIKDFSVAAVEQIIIWGLNNGYTFLPLDSTSPTSHHRIAN
ncbi:MAG: polysaccharide deacetylase family protein [Oscillospiraceae bacterium]|nr:polysaccharide deacetylase family protein [Oscillospiraceae bacterium]